MCNVREALDDDTETVVMRIPLTMGKLHLKTSRPSDSNDEYGQAYWIRDSRWEQCGQIS